MAITLRGNADSDFSNGSDFAGNVTAAALVGRTTLPAAGQIGEALSQTQEFDNEIFSQNVARTFSFDTALALTAGVWLVSSTFDYSNRDGVNGYLDVGDTIQISSPSIFRTGTEAGITALSGCTTATGFINGDDSLNSVLNNALITLTTNGSLTGANIRMNAFQNDNTPYVSFRADLMMRICAIRIA